MNPPSIRDLCARATPGPWSVPHFANPEAKCECGYILCESLCGAVATIHKTNGKPIDEGGDDNPPLEQAVANAQLIARLSPEVVMRVVELAEEIQQGSGAFSRDPLEHAGNVIEKSKQLATELLALLNGQTGGKEGM